MQRGRGTSGCINATPRCGRSAGSSRRPLIIAPNPAVYGRISRPRVVSTASSGGRPWVAGQSTGNTHSGWSTLAAPTGRSATTGIPAARSTSCGPTPDSISRCADPIAPADNTIRSADQIDGTVGPDALHANRPAAVSSGCVPTRVLVIRVRLERSIAGCRKAPPGPTRVPPLMFSGTAPTRWATVHRAWRR